MCNLPNLYCPLRNIKFPIEGVNIPLPDTSAINLHDLNLSHQHTFQVSVRVNQYASCKLFTIQLNTHLLLHTGSIGCMYVAQHTMPEQSAAKALWQNLKPPARSLYIKTRLLFRHSTCATLFYKYEMPCAFIAFPVKGGFCQAQHIIVKYI